MATRRSFLLPLLGMSLWVSGSYASAAVDPIECGGDLRSVLADAKPGARELHIVGSCIVSAPGGGPCTTSETLEVPAALEVFSQDPAALEILPGCSVRILGAFVAARPNAPIFFYGDEQSYVELPAATEIRPEWWGATAGDTTNDTTALRRAADQIQRAKGGTLLLSGEYIVGRQQLSRDAAADCSWCPEPIVRIADTTGPVEIRGTGPGAVLRAARGLRFGSFDPMNGVRSAAPGPRPPELPDPVLAQRRLAHRAHPYWGMIQLRNNVDVTIDNLELDGRIRELTLGEPYGGPGEGWQVAAHGIWAYGNRKLTIREVKTHSHGADGVLIGYEGLRKADPPRPHVLEGVDAYENGRNGLSWVGGNDLLVENSRFARNGTVRFHSPPAAGVDIEPEDSIVRNGRFVDSQFLDNVGRGIVSDQPAAEQLRPGIDARDVVVRGTGVGLCLIRGSRNHAVWVSWPGFVFERCEIEGAVFHPFRGKRHKGPVTYREVKIRDDVDTGFVYPGYRADQLFVVDGAEYVQLERTTITATHAGGVYLDPAAHPKPAVFLKDVVVNHENTWLLDQYFQSLVRNASLENVAFIGSFEKPGAEPPQGNWYIETENLAACNNVRVEGTRIGWGSVSGPVGVVCP